MTSKPFETYILEAREQINKYFKHSEDSPLTKDQKKVFQGLDYYPVNEEYHFISKLHRFDHPHEIIMEASKGDERKYIRLGYFEFQVQGKTFQLTAFKSPDSEYILVPFKDATTGIDTYGGGRYLNIDPVGSDLYKLDFNMAYNPFCAYNPKYSCILVPSENILSIPIPVGQKKFLKG